MSSNGEAPVSLDTRADAQARTGAELFALVAEVAARCGVPGAHPPAGQVPSAPWSGLLFRVGELRLLAPLAQVAWVLEVPPDLTPVPGTGNLVRGIGNHQGSLLPIFDLAVLIQGGPAVRLGTERVLVVRRDALLCGLAVSAVIGIRHCDASARRAAPSGTPALLRPLVQEAFELAGEVVPVLALDRLPAVPLPGLV